MKLTKFSQDNCHECKQLKPELEKALDELNLETENIDVQEDFDTAKEYGVRAAPTVVLENNDGEELDRFVGSKTKGEIIQWVENQ